MLRVRDVMNHELVAVPAALPVPEVVELFLQKGITGAPVTNEQGKLVGVVSRSDVARHWISAGDAVGRAWRK